MSNFHRWSLADELFIEQHYKKMTYVELAEHFDVSTTCVRSKCHQMGCIRNQTGPSAREWSDEEIAYLREHFPVESATDLADHFGLSYTTVRLKAMELGLKKAPGYSPKQFRNRYVKDYKDERYKNYKEAV